jgi:hypothetical protein
VSDGQQQSDGSEDVLIDSDRKVVEQEIQAPYVELVSDAQQQSHGREDALVDSDPKGEEHDIPAPHVDLVGDVQQQSDGREDALIDSDRKVEDDSQAAHLDSTSDAKQQSEGREDVLIDSDRKVEEHDMHLKKPNMSNSRIPTRRAPWWKPPTVDEPKIQAPPLDLMSDAKQRRSGKKDVLIDSDRKEACANKPVCCQQPLPASDVGACTEQEAYRTLADLHSAISDRSKIHECGSWNLEVSSEISTYASSEQQHSEVAVEVAEGTRDIKNPVVELQIEHACTDHNGGVRKATAVLTEVSIFAAVDEEVERDRQVMKLSRKLREIVRLELQPSLDQLQKQKLETKALIEAELETAKDQAKLRAKSKLRVSSSA